MAVQPAKNENDGVPTLADKNISVVLRSSVRGVSPATISKKFELPGLSPFRVNAMAILVPDAPVFLMVMDFDTYSRLICLVSCACRVEDVTNGMAET